MMESIQLMEEMAPWFFPVVVFVFGACIGSFLNVCILRIPKGESIVSPPSHAADGRPLLWWENIPILAWIYLRGRDRVTGEPYGFRYPMVELLTALLFVVSWKVHPPLVAVTGMLLISLFVVGTFIDLDHMILPDSITIGGTAAGILISFWLPQLHIDVANSDYLSDGFAAGVISIISALIGAGFVFWIGEIGEVVFRKPAMGLGDVKLVGCIGAFCGWQGAVFSLFGGAILGCIVLLPIILVQRMRSGKQQEPTVDEVLKTVESANTDEQTALKATDTTDAAETHEADEELEVGFGLEVPFGPMLALGGVVYFLGADRWVDPYFETLRQVIFGG